MKELTKHMTTLHNLEHSVESLSEIALTDELTKASNRRGFVQAVERELVRCSRANASAALALIDLDHFKSFNDRYGHFVGDQVLVHLATHIQSHLRPYDVFGRIGGDEFALFLGETNHAQALEVCERIRQTIAASPMQVKDESIPLELSIGVTTQNASVRFEQLYQEADAALYRAKAKGRNRVETHPLPLSIAQ
jgi:diguanylate cyclase (GGDEF)-like protein